MAKSGWKGITFPSQVNKMYLQTARLVLRNFVDGDLESFLEYRNDPKVAKYQGWNIPYSREMGEAFISSMKERVAPKQGTWLQFAITLKDSDELIGDLGCYIKDDDIRQARIGFTLASKYWRKGYMTEVVPHILEYLFEDLDIHRVAADCDVENIASYRTLEKLGFRREAHFLESYLDNGIYTSEYHYGLLQREWRKNVTGS
jgi:RimJ/RimL family protein N-acetyltransferase